MRIREKGYKDYGFFDDGEWEDVINYCRSPDFKEQSLLMDAAISTNPCIANELYESIINKNASYDKMMDKQYIPLPKGDFYGYRRKCIEEFWRMMRLTIGWE